MSNDVLVMLMTVSVAIVGSGSATAVVQHLLEKQKSNPTRDGVRLLLQDKIEHLAIKAIERQEILYTQLKYLRSAYKAYKQMRGNGDMDAIMEDVEKLPVKYNE